MKILNQKLLLLAIIALPLLMACSQDVSFSEIANKGLGSGGSNSGTVRFGSDAFTQGIQGKMLDILIVVDNSSSMAAEQSKLGQRIDTFLATLDGVEWRIGITTTDISNGPFGVKGSLLEFANTGLKFIDSKTPDYLNLFQSTIVRTESINCSPQCPSGDEQALAATIMAIEKRNSDNAGFFRPGADLGVLYLADEDEKSYGPPSATQPFEVLDAMKAAFADEKRLLSYGIVIVPDDITCFGVQAPDGNYGDFIADLVSQVGGIVGSICDSDYAPTLGLIATHARELLQYVQLSETPVPSTVKIRFEPSHQSAFTVDGKRVRIANPPPVGTQIFVDYQVL